MSENNPKTFWAFRDRQGNPCVPECVECYGISEDGMAFCVRGMPGEDYAYTYKIPAAWLRPSSKEARAAALEAAETRILESADLIRKITFLQG